MMNPITGKLFMEQLIGALKNEKLSGSLIVMFIVASWWVHGWAKQEFVNAEDFQELKGLMITFVEDMTIVNASQLIRDKELALQIAEATNQPESEIQHITKEIKDAKKYRECLIRKEPNCKHLKPPE